jgi:Zn-dependent protease/CBS domain-containing protein
MITWSLRILTIRGIDIKVHLSFVLILVFAAVQWSLLLRDPLKGSLFGIIAIILLFVCVILHELGHSFEAMRYGIKVHDITLWPIGGVARLQSLPDQPIQELRIAVAGPLVNFVLALILWLLATYVLNHSLNFDYAWIIQRLRRDDFAAIWDFLILANLVLGIFNLIPAFPMDGGRILRSLLALKLPHLYATRVAVGIGQTIALLMGIGAIFFSLGWSLLLIAVMVFWGARQEGHMAELRAVLQRARVRHALVRQSEQLTPTDTLGRAIELTLHTHQADFPVLENEKLVGILTENDLISAISQLPSETPISLAMRVQFEKISLEATLYEAQQALARMQSTALPVVLPETENFVGLLTLRDINEIYRLVLASPDLIKD